MRFSVHTTNSVVIGGIAKDFPDTRLKKSYLWRVEWFDSDGAGYITIFAGQEAESRARDYHDAIRDGRLDSRIADAQRGGPFAISERERPAPRRRKRA